jgi:predicted nucleotidyltransferase
MVTLSGVKSNIKAAREQRVSKAGSVLKKAVDVLVSEYHVEKIVLIGSLADKERFGPHSDIDLCVEGVPAKRYFQAVGELLSLSEDFDIDLIPLEDATPEMKKRAMKGKVLYEKRSTSSEAGKR